MKKALFLRTCDKDGKAHGGFQWPLKAGETVTAPDWEPTKECGKGLHGLLNGQGFSGHLSSKLDALWFVVESDLDKAIDLNGKHKFQTCKVEFVGSKEKAVQYMVDHGCSGVHFSTLTGGYGSTLTGGYGSTLTGGDWCTLTGGNRSTLTGGDWCTLTGGNRSTLTGGDWCTLTGGDHSTLAGGDHSTLTGGDWCTLTGGDHSTLTGGNRSTLTGGDGSTLSISYWDGNRNRIMIGYIGENGLEPNVAYKLNEKHEFIKA
jgi:hypothetical protein